MRNPLWPPLEKLGGQGEKAGGDLEVKWLKKKVQCSTPWETGMEVGSALEGRAKQAEHTCQALLTCL